MGEVLSQNEIDQLLNALNTGELDVEEYKTSAQDKQVKHYDFARPSKFAKEHLRTLEIIFEHYARLISTTLPAYMRNSCQVEVVNSEATAYSEFSNALTNPILLGIVDFYPLKGNILLDMSIDIGYAIVDRLLGGKGDALDRVREFSEIELTIIEKMMSVLVEQLVDPWKNVVAISPQLEQIETNPQFAQIVAPNEIVALISLNLRIGKVEGLLNVCIPYMSVETIMDKLNTKYWYSSLQDTDEETYADVIEHQIAKTQIPISAVLGKSYISVDDFINLQYGDVIKLDTRISDEIDILVGNINKFKGNPGVFERKSAIKITRVLREEDD